MDRKLIQGIIGAIFVLSLCCGLAQSQGMDLTIVPEAINTTVVEATVAKINRLAELNDELQTDNRFIRRIAWVETKDGTASRTFSDSEYHGGIWRVNRSVFDATKRMYNQPEYISIFADILNIFCISWGQATWEDCRKPLYSALSARLFFHSRNPVVPLGLNDQASVWKMAYNSDPSYTEEMFVLNVNSSESGKECMKSGIDLIFVLDGSGSVGRTHFMTTKNFVLGMVDSFNIGENKTRFGVIQFSSSPTREFQLTTHTNRESLRQAILSITFRGGGTRTGSALDFMSTTSFLPENGGRPEHQKFPRVAVVITDGRSGDSVFEAAERARDMGIILFAIGVTLSVDFTELAEIANKPSDTYVFNVGDYDAISNIGAALEYATCAQATNVDNETVAGTINIGEVQNFEVPVTENGVTLSLNASKGNAVMYVSTTTPNPNAASHDYSLMAMEGIAVSIFIGPLSINRTCEDSGEGARRRRQVPDQGGDDAGAQIGTVYITIEGLQATNDFVLAVAEGDQTAKAPLDPTNGCGYVAATVAHVVMISLNAIFAAGLANAY